MDGQEYHMKLKLNKLSKSIKPRWLLLIFGHYANLSVLEVMTNIPVCKEWSSNHHYCSSAPKHNVEEMLESIFITHLN